MAFSSSRIIFIFPFPLSPSFLLFQHGVSLYIQDKEGLSALDLVMKDRPIHVVFKKTGRK